ncbi:MAG: hypothetical protein M0D57_02975 [Sphingobacteriales bacterium JAD_PAG50586_3]|nr:MAG: hypothetical protein M0D57_02975 [Sphingobacteriales bacterium JAD_PAG50586_3]
MANKKTKRLPSSVITQSSTLRFIGDCYLKDITIPKRLDGSSYSTDLVNKLCNAYSKYCFSRPIVYTAFDGDHFHLMQYLRKYVLNKNKYPANPESILGYKNVVERHQTKYGVLLDDLAILRRCDELWIFTIPTNSTNEIADLPEGVLVELAFYLRRQPNPKIYFVDILELSKNKNAKQKPFKINFDEFKKLLVDSKKDEILALANDNFRVDPDLRKLSFYISDPLDFKYAEWLREDKSVSADEIALVLRTCF